MIIGICPICKLAVATSKSAFIVKESNKTVVYHKKCYKQKHKDNV